MSDTNQAAERLRRRREARTEYIGSVEFLDSLASRSVNNEEFGYAEWDLHRCVWVKKFGDGRILIYMHDNTLPHITTRGQLRQLLKALQ